MEKINIRQKLSLFDEYWSPKIIGELNEQYVKVVKFKGEFVWHKHDDEDEFFFVLEGTFLVDLEDETTTLESHQGYAVPKGVVHRTRAPERAVVLAVEGASVELTGD